ncbi:FkbM family methyltransferase [Patescibacteria group bacterium]|nr:FkbM family methyltransferase [Patescibacteria group bacterium]
MKVNFLNFELDLPVETEADKSVLREVFLDRDYLCLEDLIRQAGVVVDIGAHIGLFSIYAKCLNTKIALFSYEPDVRNFGLMKEALRANKFLDRDSVLKNVAVGAENGRRKFYLSEDSHNHSFLGEGKEVMVDVIDMVKILARDLQGKKCDLLKMDCEGAEFEILRSMNREQFDKISNIYVEYHEGEGRSARELGEILRENGFKVKMSISRFDCRFGFILGRK